MAVTNTYKKLDELKATAFIALKKDETLKQAAQKTAEKELENAKVLREQEEMTLEQQKSLIQANIHSEKSAAEQAVEPSKKEQKLHLPIVSKKAVSQHKGFSKEFIGFSKKAHEEAAQQVQTLAAAVAEIFAADPQTADVMNAQGGQQGFVADAVENFRQSPLYHEATPEQRNEARRIYNTFMNGAAVDLHGQQFSHTMVEEEHNKKSVHEYHCGGTISAIAQAAITRNLHHNSEAFDKVMKNVHEVLNSLKQNSLSSQQNGKSVYDSNPAITFPAPHNPGISEQTQSLNIFFSRH